MITKSIRLVIGKFTDAVSWLTGLNNWTIGRGLLILALPGLLVGESPYSVADVLWSALWIVIIALNFVASYRWERKAAIVRSYRAGIWESALFLLNVFFIITDGRLAWYSLAAFWASFFVFDHHRHRGVAPAEKQSPTSGVVYRWFLCNCGKDRQVAIDLNRSKNWASFITRTSCKTCEADIHRGTNSCPEIVRTSLGATVCGREWNHKGRCEPVDISNTVRPFP